MTPTPSERVENFPTLNYANVLELSEQNKAAASQYHHNTNFSGNLVFIFGGLVYLKNYEIAARYQKWVKNKFS